MSVVWQEHRCPQAVRLLQWFQSHVQPPSDIFWSRLCSSSTSNAFPSAQMGRELLWIEEVCILIYDLIDVKNWLCPTIYSANTLIIDSFVQILRHISITHQSQRMSSCYYGNMHSVSFVRSGITKTTPSSLLACTDIERGKRNQERPKIMQKLQKVPNIPQCYSIT